MSSERSHGFIDRLKTRYRVEPARVVSDTEAGLLFARESNTHLNHYIQITDSSAREAAQACQKRFECGESLPLDGVPISVKDQILTKGIPTSCGSRYLEGFIPPYQSTVVQRCLDAGALIYGKTNQDEFGMGSSSENSFAGPVRNPWALDKIAGGSSGGAAVSVSSGGVVCALGTDTGGSIRQPAAFNGLVGMKPTYGRVSRYGVIAYGSSLEQVGPLTQTVSDNALVLEVIAGFDPLDGTSSKEKVNRYTEAVTAGVKGLRVGIPEVFFGEGVDARIGDQVRECVSLLAAQGAEVHEIELPHARYALPTYYILASAEAASNLSRFDGIGFGRRSPNSKDLEELIAASRTEGLGIEVQRRILLGNHVLSSGYSEQYYDKALRVRRLITQDFERAWESVDILVGPTTPTLPWSIGNDSLSPLEVYQMDMLTVFCNLTGVPGLSVPCGVVDGLPVGMQIIGKPFDEATLYAAAGVVEEKSGGRVSFPEIYDGRWTGE